MKREDVFPPQYDRIVDILRPYQAYLVGGAVRDALLKRSIHDLDFALPKDTIRAAKEVADQLEGGFFILDPERETCRVILKDPTGQRLVVDFTLFQGSSIEEDLASRDFTITSLARSLEKTADLIDPFQGAQDLKQGVIRATSKSSLADDPVRCLRAVRLAAQLQFQILAETKRQLRDQQDRLVEVSPERKRDEFFRILAGPNQSAAFLSMQVLGLSPYLLPGELSSAGIRRLRDLETLWALFLADHDQERAASWAKGTLVHRLGRYREQVREYLNLELVPGRTIYQLTFIISLLSDLSNGDRELVFQRFTDQVPLSNQEVSFLSQGIKAAANWQEYSRKGGAKLAVKVYRFFGEYGHAGLAAIFSNLVDLLSAPANEIDRNQGIEKLDQARSFLEGYWERYEEWVDPPHLLDGNDLQSEFQLTPGPRIGSLLELLREEQVRRGMRVREEGLEFLKEHLSLSERRGDE